MDGRPSSLLHATARVFRSPYSAKSPNGPYQIRIDPARAGVAYKAAAGQAPRCLPEVSPGRGLAGQPTSARTLADRQDCFGRTAERELRLRAGRRAGCHGGLIRPRACHFVGEAAGVPDTGRGGSQTGYPGEPNVQATNSTWPSGEQRPRWRELPGSRCKAQLRGWLWGACARGGLSGRAMVSVGCRCSCAETARLNRNSPPLRSLRPSGGQGCPARGAGWDGVRTGVGQDD